jgi:hypothetical protein
MMVMSELLTLIDIPMLFSRPNHDILVEEVRRENQMKHELKGIMGKQNLSI